MKKQELTNLVIKAQQGDESAFEQIIKEKYDSIKYMSLSLLANYHDAEDISQEIILTIHDKLSTLQDPGAFTTWMYRIIHTSCLNKKRQDVKYKDNLDISDFSNTIEEGRSEFLPEKLMEDEEAGKIVRDIIDELPLKQKISIKLYYFGGLSHAEISKKLGVSINTVSTNIMRGKQSLEKSFTKRTADL